MNHIKSSNVLLSLRTEVDFGTKFGIQIGYIFGRYPTTLGIKTSQKGNFTLQCPNTQARTSNSLCGMLTLQ